MLLQQLENINIITKNKKINPQAYKMLCNHADIKHLVIKQTAFIKGELKDTLKQRLFCIKNNITSIPKCSNSSCTNRVIFHTSGRNAGNFGKYCCNTCANDDYKRIAKIQQTKQQRYGDKFFSNRQKARNTYGKILNINSKSLLLLQDEQWLYHQHHHDKKPLCEIAIQLGVSPTAVQNRFKQFNIPVNNYSNNSYCQIQFTQWISSLTDNILINDKTTIIPYELDVLIPDKKLAIEFNGMYWHSDKFRSKHYHVDKLNKCKDKQIDLVQIWEHDWINKKQIVQSIIQHKLSINNNTIYARKCAIKSIDDTQTIIEFLNKNHIQGYCKSKVNLGLFYNNQLISIMTFGVPRFNKNYQWELLRFCNLLNYHVPGAASKLLQYFIKIHKPKTIISYSNRERGNGNLYKQLNFCHINSTSPGYFYWYNNTIVNRIQCQKHKLLKKYSDVSEDMTEYQIMKSKGFYRIWDCGNDVWVWSNKHK